MSRTESNHKTEIKPCQKNKRYFVLIFNLDCHKTDHNWRCLQ